MVDVKAGDKFKGAVTGDIFEVVRIREERRDVGLRADYELAYGNGKTVNAAFGMMNHMIKSGGFIRV